MKSSIVIKFISLFIISIIFIVLISGFSFVIQDNYELAIDDIYFSNNTINDNNKSSIKGDINVYFYKLGTQNEDGVISNAEAEGESFIIVVDDVEILVDAGTDTGSAPAIIQQMKNHVSSDNVWDYIIVTHADKDHIAAFGAETLEKSVFSLFVGINPVMTLNTLIDFDITKDDTVEYPNKQDLFNTPYYDRYCIYRDMLVEKGVTYYTASQCLWKRRGLSNAPVPGATNIFNLDNRGTKLTILYNYYCDHKFDMDKPVAASDRNNLCVCFTIETVNFNNKIDRFLFTADLEEYDSSNGYSQIYGESKLLEENPELKEGVIFYKAGHHGSRTSSSLDFISNIKPQNVVFTGIAGNNSYKHKPNSPESYPALAVTNNIFKYTDHIYIPSMAVFDENENKIGTVDYYGDISLYYVINRGLIVETTNNMNPTTGEPNLIQNTEWFKKYRQAQISVYNFSAYSNEFSCPFGNCSLVKYGHYDILIDCGVYAFNGHTQINSTVYIDKIKQFCADGIIEYLIVSSPNTYSLQQVVDKQGKKGDVKGVLGSFKVENIIDFGEIQDPSKGFDRSLYAKYVNSKKELKDIKYYNAATMVDKDITITEGLSIDILHNDYYESDENSDVCLTINFRDQKMLFLGNNRTEALDSVNSYAKSKINDLNNVVFMLIPSYGQVESYSESLYETIYSKTTDLTLVSNTILNDDFFNRLRFTKSFCNNLIYDNQNKHHNVYVSSEMDQNNKYKEICGDIRFFIVYQESDSFNEGSYFRNIVRCSKGKVLLEQTDYYKGL